MARIAQAAIKGMLILLLVLHFSTYQVIVLKVVDGVESLPDNYVSKLKDSNNASKDNLNFYITAEIQNVPVYEKSWEFTVGDDKMYEGFVNKPLERGEEYVIFQGAVTRDRDVSKFKSVASYVGEYMKKNIYLRRYASEYMLVVLCVVIYENHSCPQGPRSFWSTPRIGPTPEVRV